MKRYLKALILSLMLAAGAVAAFAADGRNGSMAPEARAVVVKPSPGRLEITVSSAVPQRVSIYSITGQLVKTLEVADATVSIELPAGIYIVKTPERSRQYVVK